METSHHFHLTFVGLLLCGVLSCTADLTAARYQQLVEDRATAMAALSAVEEGYKTGRVSRPDWLAVRDAYRALVTAQRAAVDALQHGRETHEVRTAQVQALDALLIRAIQSGWHQEDSP